MSKITLFVALVALSTLAGGVAHAQGSMGQGKQKRCMNGGQPQIRQQMRDCSCMNSGAQQQGSGQGRMRRTEVSEGNGTKSGIQDGTGNGTTQVAPALR